MKTITISALREGTGKTAITVGLGLLATERDMRVGYIKPKGTRLQSHVGKVHDRDPILAAEILGLEEELPNLEPIVYSPMFVQNAVRGKEDPDALRERIQEAFDQVARDRDLMLLEGAGRLDMGAIVELTDRDIASLLDAGIVLVAEFDRLEDLDRLVQACQAIGDRLTGVVFNRVSREAHERLNREAIPFLEGRGIPVLGVIRHDRELAGVTVEELAGELGARRLTAVGEDTFVDQFLVAAMGPDEAFRQFRRVRNAAVVTGGDRTEIHSAAIRAPGVACLVVSGSFRPPKNILSKAERNGLAVLAVNADTLSTIERAEEIVRSGRTQTEATVRTMANYLEETIDVEELLAP